MNILVIDGQGGQLGGQLIKSLKINSVKEGLITNTYIVCDEETKEVLKNVTV